MVVLKEHRLPDDAVYESIGCKRKSNEALCVRSNEVQND